MTRTIDFVSRSRTLISPENESESKTSDEEPEVDVAKQQPTCWDWVLSPSNDHELSD